MDTNKKLIKLLEQYISEHKELKELYSHKCTIRDLYKELIESLNSGNIEDNKIIISILLTTIYGNDIYERELYGILLQENNQQKLRQFIYKIVKEYNKIQEETEELKARIKRNKNMVSSAYRAKANLKYNTPLSKDKNDIANVKRIISYYEMSGVISNKEELLLINEIESHNRLVSKKNRVKEKEHFKNLYNEIPNILSIGFQEHDVIEVSREKKPTLDKFVKEILSFIPSLSIEELLEAIASYKKYNIDDNEYNYIIVKILDELLEELVTLYQFLIDKKIYTIKEDRMEIIQNYYYSLERYLSVKKYYDKVTEYIPEEDNIQTNSIDYKQEKRFIYCHSNTNMDKARLISDMSDIPYEYYDTVYDLLNRFKNGTIGIKEFKALTNHKKYKGHLELRYDQVRIVLKHIKDNIYVILGAFAKKADNDMTMYRRIINRMLPDVNTDSKLLTQLKLSEYTETELEKLVKTKGRKGTR